MDPRTIPEFVELTKGKITQTAALATIRDVIDEDANDHHSRRKFTKLYAACMDNR